MVTQNNDCTAICFPLTRRDGIFCKQKMLLTLWPVLLVRSIYIAKFDAENKVETGHIILFSNAYIMAKSAQYT